MEGFSAAKEKLYKWIGKPMSLCAFNAKGFQTQAFTIKSPFKPCPIDLFKKFNVSTHLYGFKNSIYRITDLEKFNNKYKALVTSLKKVSASDIPEAGFKTKILETVVRFKNNGVKIKNYGHPNFTGDGVANNYVLHQFDIVPTLQALGKTSDNYINGVRRIDFEAANRKLAELWFNDANKFGDVAKLVKELNLVWHHSEDLKTLQLIPTIVHDALKPHTGGVAYVEVLRKHPEEAARYFSDFIN